ncbi:hypothetical protein [Arsenicibacter rosenii]|uniref:hypothetical protein n=1 Tax=Arsenicibacter rosenii TaxID=1750698 RepID=UPI0011603107|nr:hypothetical protein [Arsenicibacter rosenii]
MKRRDFVIRLIGGVGVLVVSPAISSTEKCYRFDDLFDRTVYNNTRYHHLKPSPLYDGIIGELHTQGRIRKGRHEYYCLGTYDYSFSNEPSLTHPSKCFSIPIKESYTLSELRVISENVMEALASIEYIIENERTIGFAFFNTVPDQLHLRYDGNFRRDRTIVT